VASTLLQGYARPSSKRNSQPKTFDGKRILAELQTPCFFIRPFLALLALLGLDVFQYQRIQTGFIQDCL